MYVFYIFLMYMYYVRVWTYYTQALYGLSRPNHAGEVWQLTPVLWTRCVLSKNYSHTNHIMQLMYTIGVEKNNDDSKCHYFSSNKHDAPGEIIRSECRQEALRQGVWDHPTCVRQKRSYSKVDSDYWNGGIKEVRKRSRTSTSDAPSSES